jgi:hypothetical protein
MTTEMKDEKLLRDGKKDCSSADDDNSHTTHDFRHLQDGIGESKRNPGRTNRSTIPSLWMSEGYDRRNGFSDFFRGTTMSPNSVAPATTVPPTVRRQAPLSLKKRIVFWLLLAAGTYLIVELISLAALRLAFGGWSAVQSVADNDAEPDAIGTAFDFPDEIVHPYLGWVRAPRPDVRSASPETAVNDYGFMGGELPLRTRSPDKVIIGILGGSLAEEFAGSSLELLAGELKKSGAFEGKELVFVRLALSGYKQPQQLVTVNYLLSLGAQFDMLINIDGYNEIVLPVVENAPNHVFLGFPRSWHLRVTEAGNLSIMRSIGRIAYLKDRAAHWSKAVQSRPWCWSATVRLVWRLYRGTLRTELFNEYANLRDLKYGDWNFAACGPVEDFASDADRFEHCAGIWARSSLQLHNLSKANGIRYFHFLQPNQYVTGSKSMGKQEKFDAWISSHPGRVPVEQGYPVLVREGRRLASQGVAFTDLTMLFADHLERTYKDACCHLNDRGNELLARKIAEVMRGTPRAD